LIRFYFTLLLLGAAIAAAIEFGVGERWFNRPSFAWQILAILFLFTGYIFFRLGKTHVRNFTQAYLLTIVLKLLLGGILISVIIVLDKKRAVENALVFIITYFAFTALEVFFLFKKINGTKD
jgi:FtsH-binding integral membrane protein